MKTGISENAPVFNEEPQARRDGNVYVLSAKLQAPSDEILAMEPAAFNNVILQSGILNDEMCNVSTLLPLFFCISLDRWTSTAEYV